MLFTPVDFPATVSLLLTKLGQWLRFRTLHQLVDQGSKPLLVIAALAWFLSTMGIEPFALAVPVALAVYCLGELLDKANSTPMHHGHRQRAAATALAASLTAMFIAIVQTLERAAMPPKPMVAPAQAWREQAQQDVQRAAHLATVAEPELRAAFCTMRDNLGACLQADDQDRYRVQARHLRHRIAEADSDRAIRATALGSLAEAVAHRQVAPDEAVRQADALIDDPARPRLLALAAPRIGSAVGITEPRRAQIVWLLHERAQVMKIPLPVLVLPSPPPAPAAPQPQRAPNGNQSQQPVPTVAEMPAPPAPEASADATEHPALAAELTTDDWLVLLATLLARFDAATAANELDAELFATLQELLLAIPDDAVPAAEIETALRTLASWTNETSAA
jgi:hypothetical protein